MADLALNSDAEVERVTRYALRAATEVSSGRRSLGDGALIFLVLCRVAMGLVCGSELHRRRRPRDGSARWAAMADALWELRDRVYGEMRGDAERPRAARRGSTLKLVPAGRRRASRRGARP